MESEVCGRERERAGLDRQERDKFMEGKGGGTEDGA